MAEFTLGIAGHSFLVRSLFDSTKDYCARYPARREPETLLTITPEQLPREQAVLRAEALAEGLRPRQFSEPFLERAVLQKLVAAYLRPFHILLLHGSTVAVDGRAYLFTAQCGTGKSTHTRLWRQEFGARAVMLNDDKPFLHLASGTVMAYGAPWSGKHGLDENRCAPLAGVCVLERGRENRILPLSRAEALPFLRTQACSPEADSLVAALAAAVPLWRMECTRDPQAARIAYHAMSAGG